MNRFVAANRATWNAWVAHDRASAHHRDAALVRAGGSSLRSVERDEVGEVAGKSLLHLLCNMGSDTLSWARLGASVTGVDISDGAIAQAQALSGETALPARFLRADLYELPTVLHEQFDIVFASYGVLCWLPDLPRFAAIAARYVRPGGMFYLVDIHPFSGMLADQTHLRPGAPYLHGTQPVEEPAPATTTGGTPATVCTWSYGLGEVVSALIAAGLHLEHLHEFPYTWWPRFAVLTQDAEGWWHWPDPANTLPLLFSVRAHA